MPAISIIIPVYNAADTIFRCVETVRIQSFDDWELLIVDDGSKDNSLEVCQQLQSLDSRIKLYSQLHGGVSSARNFALSHASGEYICFIDADDIVESNYLEQLYNYKMYDMVVCGYYVDKQLADGTLYKQELHIPDILSIHQIVDRKQLLPLFMQGMIHVNCNKLLRRNIIIENQIVYKDVPVNEDYFFMLEYLAHSQSVIFIDIPLYHWVRVEGRLSGVSVMPDNLLGIYNQAQLKTREFFSDNNLADITQYYSYCFLIQKFFNSWEHKELTYEELNRKLISFHQNELVKCSFRAYNPRSLGEWFMYWLLKRGWFHIHHVIYKLLSHMN